MIGVPRPKGSRQRGAFVFVSTKVFTLSEPVAYRVALSREAMGHCSRPPRPAYHEHLRTSPTLNTYHEYPRRTLLPAQPEHRSTHHCLPTLNILEQHTFPRPAYPGYPRATPLPACPEFPPTQMREGVKNTASRLPCPPCAS